MNFVSITKKNSRKTYLEPQWLILVELTLIVDSQTLQTLSCHYLKKYQINNDGVVKRENTKSIKRIKTSFIDVSKFA